MRRTTASGLAVAVTAAMLLAGCGSDDSDSGDSADDGASSLTGDAFAEQEPQAIIDAAEEATKGADSLRLTGTTMEDGVETTIDIAVDKDSNCTGTIAIAGGTAEIIGTGGQYWFRPDETFWRAQAGEQADQVIAVVGDKYVLNDSLDDVCDLESALEGDEDDESDDTLTQEGTEDVEGQTAVKVKKVDDEGTSTAFVLVDDPHYLVRVDDADGSSMTITDFDEPVEVEAPSEDEQIDLDSLGG